MLIPLVVLAVLSITGGWIGSGRFDKFLSPVFHPGATASTIGEARTNVEPPPSREKEHGPSEGLLTTISILAAVLGFGLAWLLYHQRPQLPQEIADSLGGFYRAVANKYYVDQLYAILFVTPLIEGSRDILWHGVDEDVIDATVNNSAEGAEHVSDSMRHMQSGNLRSYAGWVALGAAVVIAYMIWTGAR
jgi:NADH-quinone oxidoreductase subunit L